MCDQPKFRYVYVDNCSNISSQKPLFTGAFSNLDEIKERVADVMPSHPSLIVEYYNKKFGLVHRKQIDELPSDLEDIYIHLRSTKLMTCHVCTRSPHTGNNGGHK